MFHFFLSNRHHKVSTCVSMQMFSIFRMIMTTTDVFIGWKLDIIWLVRQESGD